MPDDELSLPHVYEPADEGEDGESAPTLLLLHGTGADERDLLPLGRDLAPGANRLSPRGPVNEAGRNRWFRRLAEGVFDEEDVRRRAGDLAGFVAAAADRYGFDPDRVVAVGFSNGANIASAVNLLHPGTFAGSLLLRPMTPLTPDEPPDLHGIPVLLVSGRADPMVPRDDVEGLAELYRAAGADVEHAWTEAGHGLTRDDLDVAKRWAKEHVGSG